jgi:hypothetical protein
MTYEGQVRYWRWRRAVLGFLGIEADETRLRELYERDFEPVEAVFTLMEEMG